MKKFKPFVFASVLLLVTFAFSMVSFAASVPTTEFGTFSYDLTVEGPCDRCSDVYVSGYTKITIPKPSSTVMITADLQYSATGETITTFSDKNPGGSRASIDFSWEWDRITKYSVFSCHEARGNDNIARYLKVTF